VLKFALEARKQGPFYPRRGMAAKKRIRKSSVKADGGTQMTRIILDFRRSSVDIFYLSLCVHPDPLYAHG